MYFVLVIFTHLKGIKFLKVNLNIVLIVLIKEQVNLCGN